MKVCLQTTEKNPPILKRLQLLGHRVETHDPNEVLGLKADSTDLVYLIPYSTCESEEWAQQRVYLARSSRYFLVCGEKLSTQQIVNATRDGAYDVLDYDDNDARWHQAIENASKSQALWWTLYGGHGEISEEHLVGRSGLMNNLRESVQRLGPTDATVLIMGESGTGKERVSEAIHHSSGKGAFVPVNCAAIPPDLLESELFGVEKGAFTGANRDKPGLVEEAEGGTLFLDEIGEMEITLQPKLLRFLETRRARRVGSTKEYTCHLRLISATNRDLRLESEEGRFRLDLYYRLSEVIINTPPLRHHNQDIPDLVRLFLRDAAERMGKNFETIEPELVYKFQHYDWPGNVRELKQVIDRLAIHYDGPVMREAWWHIPEPLQPKHIHPGAYQEQPAMANTPPLAQDSAAYPPLHQAAQPPAPTPVAMMPTPMGQPVMGGRTGMPNKREKMELAKRLLDESDNDLTWTAAQMGIHPTTLYRWRKAGKV